jgi:hypothetical protein
MSRTFGLQKSVFLNINTSRRMERISENKGRAYTAPLFSGFFFAFRDRLNVDTEYPKRQNERAASIEDGRAENRALLAVVNYSMHPFARTARPGDGIFQ